MTPLPRLWLFLVFSALLCALPVRATLVGATHLSLWPDASLVIAVDELLERSNSAPPRPEITTLKVVFPAREEARRNFLGREVEWLAVIARNFPNLEVRGPSGC